MRPLINHLIRGQQEVNQNTKYLLSPLGSVTLGMFPCISYLKVTQQVRIYVPLHPTYSLRHTLCVLCGLIQPLVSGEQSQISPVYGCWDTREREHIHSPQSQVPCPEFKVEMETLNGKGLISNRHTYNIICIIYRTYIGIVQCKCKYVPNNNNLNTHVHNKGSSPLHLRLWVSTGQLKLLHSHASP